MKKKAGRLGSADLAAAITSAADNAKARIGQIDGKSIESVAGGIDLSDTSSPTGVDDVATDGMWPGDDGNDPSDPFGGTFDPAGSPDLLGD